MQARRRRLAFWGVLALLVAIGLALAFWPRPVIVDLIAVGRGELVVTVDEEGEARVHDVYVISAPVTGRMRRIALHAGDAVEAVATTVAEIEPIDPAFLDPRSEAQARADVRAAESAETLSRAEVEMAQAELDFAESEVERARELMRQGLVSERELDSAERTYRTRGAALNTARAAHEMRLFQLERARAELVSPVDTEARRGVCACIALRSPVTGRVLRVLEKSEGVVQAGTPLVEVGDPRDLEIVVDLLSADAVRVEAGQRVIIEGWGGQKPLEGRVRIVEPFGFTKVSALGIEEQRVNVVIDLTSPMEDWARLAHGYQVDARIVLSEGEGVLTLPLTALFRDGEAWAVFVESRGRAELRRVEIGRRNGVAAEVVGGLREGERVVLHPSDRVVGGALIAARGS
jgi:HlyD family secretion protein